MSIPYWTAEKHPVSAGVHIPISIDFYQEGYLGGLEIKEVGRYLKEKTDIPVRICGNICQGLSEEGAEAAAQELARIRVKDPGRRLARGIPFESELDYEKRRIKNSGWKAVGILYEGGFYQEVILNMISESEVNLERCSILFTNQLFGTWDRDDQRYHARTSIYGFPNLISVTGLVEGPAKPKAFYLGRQMGVPVGRLKEEYRDQFLDHDDLRMTEVVKGYAMQAFFFHLTGNPFCEDRDCRLFNSHWQEELVHSQLKGQYEFCPTHEAVLKRVRCRDDRNEP
jgi:hypothetical protein